MQHTNRCGTPPRAIVANGIPCSGDQRPHNSRVSLFYQFWNEESGAIISAELIIVATIVVLGLMVGLVSVRDAIVTEFFDLSMAIGALNQSYIFSGFRSWGHRRCVTRSTGSGFIDRGFQFAGHAVPPHGVVFSDIGVDGTPFGWGQSFPEFPGGRGGFQFAPPMSPNPHWQESSAQSFDRHAYSEFETAPPVPPAPAYGPDGH